MIIFENIEDKNNDFNGDIINNIISTIDIPRHIHTFWVDFANSTTGVDENVVINYIYIIIKFI